MIVMLQPDQISAFWPAIKHGMVVAHKIPKYNQGEWCNKILERALTGKVQCWAGFVDKEDERKLVALGVTSIEETPLGDKVLWIHTLYAFRVIPEDILKDTMPTIEKFAKEVGCTKLVTYTYNDRIREYCLNSGFMLDPTVLFKEVR